MIDMARYARNLIVSNEREQNFDLAEQMAYPPRPERYLHQAPCEECKGDGYHMMNVEGDALDMVNCTTCRGAGLISTWRRK